MGTKLHHTTFDPSMVAPTLRLPSTAPFPTFISGRVTWGLSKITLPGNPPIAGQSRSYRGPTNSNRGAMLGIAAVSVSLLAVLIQALAFLHPYLETGSSDWQALTGGTRPIAVQSPSNRGPIAEFGVKLRFAASSPCQQSDLKSTVWACNDSRGNFCARPRSQNERDVRRHHATSTFIIISLPHGKPFLTPRQLLDDESEELSLLLRLLLFSALAAPAFFAAIF